MKKRIGFGLVILCLTAATACKTKGPTEYRVRSLNSENRTAPERNL